MLNGIGTVCAFVAFIAICLWAYNPRKKKQFDEAALLPFADEPSFSQSNSVNQDTKNGDTLK
jgi:cytochrome c oxidase cbb3-type subunit 4